MSRVCAAWLSTLSWRRAPDVATGCDVIVIVYMFLCSFHRDARIHQSNAERHCWWLWILLTISITCKCNRWTTRYCSNTVFLQVNRLPPILLLVWRNEIRNRISSQSGVRGPPGGEKCGVWGSTKWRKLQEIKSDEVPKFVCSKTMIVNLSFGLGIAVCLLEPSNLCGQCRQKRHGTIKSPC